MEPVTVYHNPRCSKSRAALQILREHSIPVEIVEYLTNPPDRATLARIIALLVDPVEQLVRRDDRFVELGLDDGELTGPEAVLDVLVAHPELLERPVVVRDRRALIARPPERVLELLD